MRLIGLEAPGAWKPAQPPSMTYKSSEHTELASPNAVSGWQSPADLKKAFAELPEEAHELLEDSRTTRLVRISKASEGLDDILAEQRGSVGLALPSPSKEVVTGASPPRRTHGESIQIVDTSTLPVVTHPSEGGQAVEGTQRSLDKIYKKEDAFGSQRRTPRQPASSANPAAFASFQQEPSNQSPTKVQSSHLSQTFHHQKSAYSRTSAKQSPDIGSAACGSFSKKGPA